MDSLIDSNILAGVLTATELKNRSGLELLKAMADGLLPMPPMAKTLGFRLAEAETGRVIFRGEPQIEYYNPLGTVHGGWIATLLDSCMGCAVHTTLPAGVLYTSLEFKIDMLAAITAETGPVTAEGHVTRSGKQVGVATGELRDENATILARGSTTCLIFR